MGGDNFKAAVFGFPVLFFLLFLFFFFVFEGCIPLEYLQSTAKQPALDSPRSSQPATEASSLPFL